MLKAIEEVVQLALEQHPSLRVKYLLCRVTCLENYLPDIQAVDSLEIAGKELGFQIGDDSVADLVGLDSGK